MAQDSNNNCTAKGDAKVVKDAVKKGVKDSSKPVDKPRRVKKKEVAPDYMTRVVVRQLPPTMTEEQFLNDISPLPEYSEFYFVNGDLSLGEFAFSRAYFKFKNFEEMLIFKDKFDDYVFLDSKGNEFPAIVEFAPLQKMPRPSSEAKKTKQDIKMNTIESDPEYIAFVEELKNTNSTSPPPYSADALLEEIENNKLSKDNDSQLTPLLEFIGKKREEKLKMKEDKKRKKDETKKKKAITKEVKAKEQETKQKANNKPPAQEVKYVIKVKSETKVNPQKAADDSAKVKPAAQKPSNTSNLDNKKDKAKPSTEEKSAKQKEPNTKPARIRNKDRPAREIYRPGSKPKTQQQPQQQQQQQPQQHPPSQPPPTASSSAVGTNAGPSESSTAGKAKVAASSDQGEKPVQNTNTTTTTINTTKSSNTQSKPFKKYRVFTRTKN